jgi:multisubunit Na+/H+ antiporter MnhB subunit
VITAITVFLGFSLAFLRFWAFEAPGDWTAYSIAAVVILLLPICTQIYTLFRALQVEDDDEHVYRRTIKWFIWSVVGMLVAVCVAAVVLSGVLASKVS